MHLDVPDDRNIDNISHFEMSYLLPICATVRFRNLRRRKNENELDAAFFSKSFPNLLGMNIRHESPKFAAIKLESVKMELW